MIRSIVKLPRSRRVTHAAGAATARVSGLSGLRAIARFHRRPSRHESASDDGASFRPDCELNRTIQQLNVLER